MGQSARPIPDTRRAGTTPPTPSNMVYSLRPEIGEKSGSNAAPRGKVGAETADIRSARLLGTRVQSEHMVISMRPDDRGEQVTRGDD